MVGPVPYPSHAVNGVHVNASPTSSAGDEQPEPRTQRGILLFWLPLAATWVMMASEGPFLAAVIARLPEPTFNLAAHGVAFALAILIEAPVIMLMSAATSIVKDRVSFLKLRNFSRGLCLGTTLLLLVVLIPSVYGTLIRDLMGVPERVAELTYGALWFMLPWPSAIGYRRFLQGVLIRSGQTRLVAYGTMIRLVGMVAAALFGFFVLGIPGAWVGALSLATGVTTEAIAARFMAAGTVRAILDGAWDAGPPRDIRYADIAKFYYPLALTSLIGLTVQPLLTFFMGRSVSPVESLAVFPVVHSLSFFFRSMGLAFQDTAIALMGDRFEHFPQLSRFAVLLGGATTLGLGLVAFTPLSDVYFIGISGLTPTLAAFALPPTRVIVLLPALSVLLSLQRAILVESRRTQHITVASALEVATVAVTFTIFGFGLDWVGATAAFAAFLAGRTMSNVYLAWGCRGVVEGRR
jgi:progressive ankylosis protein